MLMACIVVLTLLTTAKIRGGKPMIEKNVYKKWIFPVLAIFLLIAALLLWQYKKQETEYSIIQAIIEELPNYQSEIES